MFVKENYKVRTFHYFAIMGWLPFSTKKIEPVSHQLHQKSHQPLNLNAEDSDISHTLSQISDNDNLVVTENKAESHNEVNKSVESFIQQNPKNLFIIDGEKDIAQSIICTEDANGGKTCLKLQYNSIQLFKQMQKLEYFCSLPDDIDATYFECRKIK